MAAPQSGTQKGVSIDVKLEKLQKMASEIWTWPMGGAGFDDKRRRYMSAIIRLIRTMDPDWEVSDIWTNEVMIEAHTRLLWMSSATAPTEAANRYDNFVHILYNKYYRPLSNEAMGGKESKSYQAALDRFVTDAMKATNENEAWTFITKDLKYRTRIMTTAATITTQMLESHKENDARVNKLWDKRRGSGLD